VLAGHARQAQLGTAVNTSRPPHLGVEWALKRILRRAEDARVRDLHTHRLVLRDNETTQ